MTRTTLNFILDTILLVNILVVLWITSVLHFVFPPASGSTGWRLWGASYDGWMQAQLASLAVFGVGVLLHVMLHWSWVCGVIAHRLSTWRGTKIKIDSANETLIGVAFFVVILHVLAIAFMAAMFSITKPVDRRSRFGRGFLQDRSPLAAAVDGTDRLTISQTSPDERQSQRGG